MPNASHILHKSEPAGSGTAQDSAILPHLAITRNLPTHPIPIAEMAELFGVTHRTLHFYEEKGLIKANRIGLMRVYSPRNIQRMALVNTCREIGMSVSGIQDLFEELTLVESQAEADRLLEAALTTRKRELTSNLSSLHRQLQQINGLLAHDIPFTPRKTVMREGPALTPAEQSCLELMAEGYSSIKIARSRGMRVEEVETMEESLIIKLDANNRFQAVAKAVLLGMVAN